MPWLGAGDAFECSGQQLADLGPGVFGHLCLLRVIGLKETSRRGREPDTGSGHEFISVDDSLQHGLYIAASPAEMFVMGVMVVAWLTEPLREGGLQLLIVIGLAEPAFQSRTQQAFRYRGDEVPVAVWLARAAGHASPQAVAMDAESLEPGLGHQAGDRRFVHRQRGLAGLLRTALSYLVQAGRLVAACARKLAAQTVHLIHDCSAEVRSQVVDALQVVDPGDRADGMQERVLSQVGITCASQDETLDPWICPERHQLWRELLFPARDGDGWPTEAASKAIGVGQRTSPLPMTCRGSSNGVWEAIRSRWLALDNSG